MPYTSCDADAPELAKLARPGLDPSGSVFDRARLGMLRWYAGTGVTPSMGNMVTPYIFGRCAFRDMADAIATARAPEHRIYLLGWWVEPWTRLDSTMPPLLLQDLLKVVKGQVRGMFWKDPQPKPTADNTPIVGFLNGLPNGAAILDQKLPFLRLAGSQTGIRGGVHHQKLLVVSGASGLVGFTGGMDLNNSRVNNSKGGFDPLHDVHFRVTGQACIDLLRVFRQRWLDHPDSAALDLARFGLSAQDVTNDFDVIARRGGTAAELPTSTDTRTKRGTRTHAVAVGRTYANLRKFNTTESYSFAPSGEETAWALVSKAVQTAQRFIYLEEQYFVSRRLKAALVRKLQEPQFQALIVLMQHSSAFEKSATLADNEFPYLIAARNEIRADFAAVDPKQLKWSLFTLRATSDPDRQEWAGSYVHSKTLIADDECAIIGTVNVNDRGYTYDTEIAASITDDVFGRVSGQSFARDLRIALWHKHLGVAHAKLLDFNTARQLWKRAPPTAMISDANALEDSILLGPKAILRDHVQAEQLWREDIDPDADRLP